MLRHAAILLLNSIMKACFKSLILVLFLIFFLVGLFSSCKKENSVDSSGTENVSREADSLIDKSLEDTSYLNSDAHTFDMQHFDNDLSQKTSLMTDNQRLLVYFESYLRMLKQYSSKIVKNPSLAKNQKYMIETQRWAYKVREYHEALMKAHLDNNQMKRFNYLNDNFKKM